MLHQQIEQLKVENAQLKSKNSQMKSENSHLQVENLQLQATIKAVESSKVAFPVAPMLASSKHYIKWTQLADLPVPLYYAHAIVQGSKIYVTGQSSEPGMDYQVFCWTLPKIIGYNYHRQNISVVFFKSLVVSSLSLVDVLLLQIRGLSQEFLKMS